MAYISFKPTDHFNTKLYTGTGSSNAITGVGFQPDFTWIKNRDAADNHMLFNSPSGVTKYVHSNLNTAETTQTESLKTFDSGGFTVGTYGDVNTNTEDYASWNWKAGTTSVPSGGTITPSAVSINTTSGFGIYRYTGTGSNGTIAHGLGTAPKFVIGKRMVGSTGDWNSWHTALTSGTYYVNLNATSAETGWTTTVYTAEPTSTVINLGTYAGVNQSTHTYLIYAFAPVKGYSSFGKYQGNASATNSPYIYTGFEPAMVIIKRKDGANGWGMKTAKTQAYNGADVTLFANAAGAESSFSDNKVDLLSNGFKIRTTSSDFNTNGGNYIYMAWAKNPIVGSDGTAGVAR